MKFLKCILRKKLNFMQEVIYEALSLHKINDYFVVCIYISSTFHSFNMNRHRQLMFPL